MCPNLSPTIALAHTLTKGYKLLALTPFILSPRPFIQAFDHMCGWFNGVNGLTGNEWNPVRNAIHSLSVDSVQRSVIILC